MKPILLACLFAPALACCLSPSSSVHSARKVIERFIGPRAGEIDLRIVASDQSEFYEYEAQNGRLSIRGSSPVALCHGFYAYMKVHGLGVRSWSGKRAEIPQRWPDARKTRGETPYRYRQYFNVVTFGYSLPYWDWNRWEQEIDWMALHGLNMPLALVATEAIAQRVWLKLGLKQDEIDAFYTGPAHLPWQRMGNLIRFEGPLPQAWHKDQVRLQHRILKRLRELGMHPIAPGFGGFVPSAIKRLHPDVKLHRVRWGGGFSEEYEADMIFPDDPLFKTIGTMMVQEWEKEFGKNNHYLADSFNEMSLPVDKDRCRAMLESFGKGVYEAIHNANPEATWVMQGWMLGFQRGDWTPENLQALLGGVPDDKMIILDMAADYNARWWRNGMNWDHFNGFFGKQWVYSTIPNMGGKTAFTGHLDYYASGHVEALRSTNRGRLIGYGFAPEGIENNEILYELLSDAAWTTSEIDLDQWIPQYLKARYGACPPPLIRAWQLLRESSYGTFTDHPQFGWQLAWDRGCTVNLSPKVREAALLYLSCSKELGRQPLFRADAIELAAMALGIKAQHELDAIKNAKAPSIRAEQQFLDTLMTIDRLLASHPTHRLDRWIRWARGHSADPALKNYYEANAKRIITTWGGTIDDYACRIWSGLIRDYYIPRYRLRFEQRRSGNPIDIKAWEEKWVRTPGVSRARPFSDPLIAAAQALAPQ